jgi:hypothetical protein
MGAVMNVVESKLPILVSIAASLPFPTLIIPTFIYQRPELFDCVSMISHCEDVITPGAQCKY